MRGARRCELLQPHFEIQSPFTNYTTTTGTTTTTTRRSFTSCHSRDSACLYKVERDLHDEKPEGHTSSTLVCTMIHWLMLSSPSSLTLHSNSGLSSRILMRVQIDLTTPLDTTDSLLDVRTDATGGSRQLSYAFPDGVAYSVHSFEGGVGLVATELQP